MDKKLPAEALAKQIKALVNQLDKKLYSVQLPIDFPSKDKGQADGSKGDAEQQASLQSRQDEEVDDEKTVVAPDNYGINNAANANVDQKSLGEMKKRNERCIFQFGKGVFGEVSLIFDNKNRRFYAVKQFVNDNKQDYLEEKL